MKEWKIEDAIADLKNAHARTTKGVWGKGKTTHETVARNVDNPPYKIADFHHADDAQFVDLAHALVPSLIERLESLEKDANKAVAMLIRYREETPLGSQPHMIAQDADELITAMQANKGV